MNSPSSPTNGYDIIVIGAGHNGLTTAALLAKRGRKVLILERRKIIGGMAAGEEFHPGYRSAGLLHDTTGIRPDVVETLGLERHGLSFTPEPPAIFAPHKQGRGLLLHRDPQKAAQEIGTLSARDAERYAEYRAFFARIGKFTSRLFSKPPPDLTADGAAGWLQLFSGGLSLRRLGRRDMMDLLRITPMCVADWLNEWFDTELLKCLVAAPAIHGTFMGPRSPGSNANLLRWETLAGRAVQGGPQSLINALEAAAKAFGVEIRVETEVQGIHISGGQVDGVTLDRGEFIHAPLVAASCDPKRTFLRLMSPHDVPPKLQHEITNLRTRGTTAKINLALNAPLRFACRPELDIEYARTGETLDCLERAFDAVKYGRFSQTPILDVYVPTVANPNLAPQGHCVVSILAHYVPYQLALPTGGISGPQRGHARPGPTMLPAGWNDQRREKLGDAVINVLSHYAPDVRDSIVGSEVLCPADIEQRYGVTQGHIHHGEHALDQMLARPCPQCARYATPLDGLYLCGSGSHPGGGLTCAPGAIAASVILKRHARRQHAFHG